ncbi:MAG: hypothetical protein K0U40_09725 [Betaproteobacteria bacterium]|nr:hypothetical protein [Betaproteobacteria bacterium]
MVTRRNYILLFLLILFLCGTIKHSFATHISKPIIVEPKTEYSIGEKVTLNGWAEYNEQPTADVLLNFKVSKSDDTAIIDQSQSTDQHGHFEFQFDTKDLTPGLFNITITSHCKEIHRPICTYKNQTLTINLK